MKKFTKTALMILSLTIFSCQSNPAGTNSNSSPNPSSSSSPSTDPITLSGDFKYVGQLVDKTASGYVVSTDGSNDMQFSYSQNFPNEVEIKGVTISRLENGKPYQVTGWTSLTTQAYWITAVEINGNILNKEKTLTLGKFSGNVNFNFYCSEKNAEVYELKKSGTEYQMDITYSSNGAEQTITKMVKL